jgi:nucleoid-associated protein YgaU
MFGSALDSEQAFDKMGGMARTRVRRSTSIILVMGLALGLALARSGREGTTPLRQAAAHRYVIRPGDTLWSIAGRYQSSGDRRSLVDAIQRANQVDPGALVPGQALIVPAPR